MEASLVLHLLAGLILLFTFLMQCPGLSLWSSTNSPVPRRLTSLVYFPLGCELFDEGYFFFLPYPQHLAGISGIAG